MPRISIVCAFLFILPSMAAPAAQAPVTGDRPAAARSFRATALARFDSPWALAFLPDGAVYLLEDKAGGRLLRLTPDR